MHIKYQMRIGYWQMWNVLSLHNYGRRVGAREPGRNSRRYLFRLEQFRTWGTFLEKFVIQTRDYRVHIKVADRLNNTAGAKLQNICSSEAHEYYALTSIDCRGRAQGQPRVILNVWTLDFSHPLLEGTEYNAGCRHRLLSLSVESIVSYNYDFVKVIL